MSLQCKPLEYRKRSSVPLGEPIPKGTQFQRDGTTIITLELRANDYLLQGQVPKSSADFVVETQAFFAAQGREALYWRDTLAITPEAARATKEPMLLSAVSAGYLINCSVNGAHPDYSAIHMPYSSRLGDYAWVRMITTQHLADEEIKTVADVVEQAVRGRYSSPDRWPPMMFRQRL